MVYIGIKSTASPSMANQREAAAYILHELITSHAPEVIPYSLSHTDMGRPYIAEAKNTDISISHTEEYAACAIISGDGKRIGIDMEKVKISKPKIAKKYFTKEEEEALSYLCADDAAREFTKLWTKYEAKSKYLGGGLADMKKRADVYVHTFMFTGKNRNEYAVSICTKEKENTDIVIF